MIGSLMGAWLAGQQVPHVLLLGRSGRPGADSGAVVELAGGDGCAAAFHLERCDAASAEEVASVAASATRGQRLQGVVHSGGVLADATIANQTLPGILTSFAPKPVGASLWQRPVGLQPAVMHLTFSSVAALLGSPGQANYSVANAALDAMAQRWQTQVSCPARTEQGQRRCAVWPCKLKVLPLKHRQSLLTPQTVPSNSPLSHLPSPQGLGGLSMQWGAWAEGGMAMAHAGTAKTIERLGMAMIAPEQGVGAFQALLLQAAPAALPAVTAAVPFRWGRYIPRLGPGPVPPMYAAFAAEAEAEAAAEAAQAAAEAAAAAAAAVASDSEAEEPATGPVRRAAAAPAGRRRRAAGKRAPRAAGAAGASTEAPDVAARKEYMVGQVQEAVAAVLGSPVGLEDPLMASGLDSLSSGAHCAASRSSAAFFEMMRTACVPC